MTDVGVGRVVRRLGLEVLGSGAEYERCVIQPQNITDPAVRDELCQGFLARARLREGLRNFAKELREPAKQIRGTVK